MNPEFGFQPAVAPPTSNMPGMFPNLIPGAPSSSGALALIQSSNVIVLSKLQGYGGPTPAGVMPIAVDLGPAAAPIGPSGIGWTSPPQGHFPTQPSGPNPAILVSHSILNYVIKNGQTNTEVARVEPSLSSPNMLMLKGVNPADQILQFGLNPSSISTVPSLIIALPTGQNFILSAESKMEKEKDKGKHKDKPKKQDKEKDRKKDKDKDKKQQFVLRNSADGSPLFKITRKGKEANNLHLQMKVKSCHGKEEKDGTCEVEGIGSDANSKDLQIRFKSSKHSHDLGGNSFQKAQIIACVVGILDLLPAAKSSGGMVMPHY